MEEKDNKVIELDILKKAGLTESQAKGYLALIENGELTPAAIADKTGESRTNGYMIAEKLEKLGLAHKTDGVKTAYAAENPQKIKVLLTRRQRQLRESSDALTGILPGIMSRFRLMSDQPGVMTYEGVSSIRVVYDAIISTGKDVLIFPSPYDRNDPEISSLIDKQIERQNKAGIKVLSLIQSDEWNTLKTYQTNLLELRKLPDRMKFDAQIMIFGDNVVSTVYNKGVVSTIINSPQMAETLRSVFFAIWNIAGST